MVPADVLGKILRDSDLAAGYGAVIVTLCAHERYLARNRHRAAEVRHEYERAVKYAHQKQRLSGVFLAEFPARLRNFRLYLLLCEDNALYVLCKIVC